MSKINYEDDDEVDFNYDDDWLIKRWPDGRVQKIKKN
jgi:hypothetical protein